MVITKKHIINIALLSTVLFFAFLFTSAFVFADDTIVSNVHISVPASCNLESDVDEVHSASINNGTYRADIGVTFFTITCNDSGGYSVYAVGYTNNEFGNTKLLATIGGSLNPTYDIITGIGTNSTETGGVSNWAMKLTPIPGTYAPTIESAPNTSGGQSASFSSYHTVPSTYTKVATFPSNTDSTTGSSFASTYAAYIAANQPAGTYSGKVKYTMVHPASEVPPMPHDCTTNKICYWPNASNVTDNMGDQSASTSADTMLWPTNFSRSGYGFAGWSDQFDYDLNSSTNTGHIYGPMESITTPSDMATKGLSLYAIWVPSAGNLQNWQGCGAMNIGDVTALTDQRDNDTYAVAKLVDGKCWMIENLRLDHTNSDNTTGALSQGYGGQFEGLALPETANYTATFGAADATPANSLYYAGTGNEGNLGATINILQENYAGSRMPRYRNNNTNTTVANMANAIQNIYSYGNYYSWPAAKANTNYLNTFANSNAANTSLCPTGWKLPTGTGSGDFGNLSNSLGGYKDANDVAQTMSSSTTPTGTDMSKTLRSYPNNLVYSGYVYESSVNSRGSNGNYWSATASGTTSAYYLYFYSTYAYPGTYYNSKYLGKSIRCVVSPSA